MVHAASIPEAVLRLAAREAKSLIQSSPEGDGPSPEIAEPSIPLWDLKVDDNRGDLREGRSRLEELARDTGIRQHQVYVGDDRGYVRISEDSSGWHVTELGMNRLAEQLDAAAAWLEEHAAGDPFTRLLRVPEFHLHAFWLLSEEGAADRIVLADAPPGVVPGLQRHVLYTESEFLRLLSYGEPIIGIRRSRTS